jgi:soluble lytic murein transglycosylase-like protein
LNESTYYRSAAAAQAILSQSARIDVDGKWGRFSQSAYNSAPADARRAVDSVVRALSGATVKDLASYRDVQRRMGEAAAAKAVGTGNIQEMIKALALKEGVPSITALKIAKIESNFNPKAVSPTGAKGVYQLTTIAIKDVKQRGGGYVVKDAFDPVQNITGGLKYMKIVARDMDVGLNETAKLYMGFNIGPSGAKHVLAGKPELAAKQISQQAFGPPSVYAANLTKKVNLA